MWPGDIYLAIETLRDFVQELKQVNHPPPGYLQSSLLELDKLELILGQYCETNEEWQKTQRRKS